MKRGTTPTYIVTVPGVKLLDKTVYLTICGVHGETVTKTGDELRVTEDAFGSTIAFRLTQADTLALPQGTASVQVRFIDAEGEACATSMAYLRVEPILLEGEIEYRGGQDEHDEDEYDEYEGDQGDE